MGVMGLVAVTVVVIIGADVLVGIASAGTVKGKKGSEVAGRCGVGNGKRSVACATVFRLTVSAVAGRVVFSGAELAAVAQPSSDSAATKTRHVVKIVFKVHLSSLAERQIDYNATVQNTNP